MTKYDSTPKWQHLHWDFRLPPELFCQVPQLAALASPAPQSPLRSGHGGQRHPPDHHPAGGLSARAHVLPTQPPLPAGHGALSHRHPQGPGHLLVWSQIDQLLYLFPSDVHHELLPCHGVLHIHGHGLWPLCGHLPTIEVPIHHHRPICCKGNYLYFSQKCPFHNAHPRPLCTTPLLWEKCHWELHLCQYVCVQALLWWCHHQPCLPVCWRLDSAGIWPHPHLPLLHPHTAGCSETQGRRSCGQGPKHMWLPLHPYPLLQHHPPGLCPHSCGKEEGVPWCASLAQCSPSCHSCGPQPHCLWGANPGNQARNPEVTEKRLVIKTTWISAFLK